MKGERQESEEERKEGYTEGKRKVGKRPGKEEEKDVYNVKRKEERVEGRKVIRQKEII